MLEDVCEDGAAETIAVEGQPLLRVRHDVGRRSEIQSDILRVLGKLGPKRTTTTTDVQHRAGVGTYKSLDEIPTGPRCNRYSFAQDWDPIKYHEPWFERRHGAGG